MSRKYKFRNPEAAYFVSFATCFWIDVFTRQCYFSILEQSLSFCRSVKKMCVYAYCFMPSHVHLIFRAEEENPSEVLRDFKAYTAKRVLEEIEAHPQESRQEWMLALFEQNKPRQFWQHHNKPIELWSDKVVNQKIYYVHMNPVRAGFVTSPEHWKYSSAKNYNRLADSQIVIDI